MSLDDNKIAWLQQTRQMAGANTSPNSSPAANPPAGGPSAETGADGPGASLVNSADFKRLVEAMEADSDEADKDWKSQINDSVFTYLQPEQKSAYSQDGSLCAQAQGDFNAEWNKIVFNKGGDPAKLLQTYDVFSLRIGALQRSNERVQALIEIGVDASIGGLIKLLRQWNKIQIIHEFEARVASFRKQVEEAEHEVTKVEIKAGLNGLASALALIVFPESLLVSLAMIGAHIVIDHVLGEPSATGTVVFVVGDSKEPVSALSETAEEALAKWKYSGKALGAAGAVVTGCLDGKEIWEGKEKVERIVKGLEALEKRLDEVTNETGELPMQLKMLDAALQALQQQVAGAIGRGNDAAKNYDAIKAEIDKVLSGA